MHILSAPIDTRQYLSGPRTPQQVRSNGYKFATDWQTAWKFPTEAQAKAKARAVARHMGWDADRITIETL